ncbi:MAG: type II toxin-antitoxin system RelE/ParE family toxin [Candidatus Paceibacterota bacterium]|jgi:mRNA interferase RelE/StbE
MAYKLILRAKAEKELDKIPAVHREKVTKMLRSLADDPFQGKKLEGELKGKYSVRAWPYRIIYEIRRHELYVIVVHIGHRKDVYLK